ncbi:MAG: hypothetical protein FJ144_08700 [Deltaproteobacteria bacterium]|nr:hypothetical protein [Deltaproteobacteria bacterium]
MSSRERVSSVAAAIALVLAGCAGDGPGPGSASGDFAEIQTEIFDVSCISAGCHGAVSPQGGLTLVAGLSYDQLVDVEPTNAFARDMGLLRVAPGLVDDSYLVRKLTGNLTPGEGIRMPQGAAPLSDDQIQLVISWIADGAPPPSDEPTPTPDVQ